MGLLSGVALVLLLLPSTQSVYIHVIRGPCPWGIWTSQEDRKNLEDRQGHRSPRACGSTYPAQGLLSPTPHPSPPCLQYKGFKVQLESVKKLINLEDDQVTTDKNFPPPICRHPALPLDLQPVCTSQEAVSIFSSLRSIAMDNCELCVNVACTGCF
ncbi:guanylate cyclase activator 2B [Ochotona princeps]|uniref:guanylate cyclase activator 2B n=1 Tax=Ochotona princeps TaxID=9978 RepID=UPI002714A5B3|nr:guanylate cyclase activator 2B [Ochotona princeps]